MKRCASLWVLASVATVLPGGATVARAQDPTTRTEQIELARRQKHATLWPEREGPLVAKANELTDRGFIEGFRSGEGANGWQVMLNGTRPNQGQTFGVGYRRADLFHDALSARGTVRATIPGAVLVDFQANLNRVQRSDDTFVEVYTKYERSPRMEFYGLGRDSSAADRTNYLLETVSGEVRGGYRFSRYFNAGLAFTSGHVHTGSTSRDGVPSIETIFDATTAPGLFDAATFVSWGGFVGFDSRDLPSGPKRGGFYGLSFDRYVDVTTGRYSHRRIDVEAQQFFPYFNDTRAVAVFVRSQLAYVGRNDGVVPFYLLPTLGGNFSLRGFGQYRFHDNNAFMASIEHRWYAFTGLEMAAFVDAGKTVAQKGQIDWTRLNYSGGIGFRVRVQDAIVMRFDIARSREGTRLILSLSDISRRRF